MSARITGMTIIEEIRKNPEEGAKRLERECKPGLLALARRLCHDPGDAEELVNHTMAEAVARIDSLLSQSALFGWMCQILVGCHEKETRRKSNSTVVLDPDTAESAADPAADTRIVRDVDASLLRDAIQALPKEMRDVIVMHFLMEQPVSGVAKFLALPVSTVKWRLHCAKEELARRLGAKAAEIARKPGAKAVLLALALCALTALGAGASLAVSRLLSRPAEPQGQQADNSTGGATSPLPAVAVDGALSDTAFRLSPYQPFTLVNHQGEPTMSTTLRTLAASAAFAAATTAIPATASADDISVTGSAQTGGLLSSLRLSFPASASPTRLFLAWGAADCGSSLGNWDEVDWLADVPAGDTSCDAPVTTLRSGLPFVRVFRIAPDDSAVELESVTATGTQYVKTSFTPAARTAVRCDFTLDAFANQAIFGCRSAAGANSFCLLTIVPSGSAGHGWRFDYGSQIKNSGVDPAAGRRYLAEADYRGLKIDGSLLSNATIGSLGTVTPGCVMALFGMSTAGGVNSQAQATIHSFKAWSDTDSKVTTLTADLVPCRKNGVVSFYNRANGTFESLVTGTLIGGADKAHSSCGTTVDTSAAFNPYGTDRVMSIVKFYRNHRQPTADLTFTAGLADCALVAAHDSVDHGGAIADWPSESTVLLATGPAATTSLTVSIPWRIEDGEDHYFRFFLVARSGSATYDRQFEGIRATGTQYVLTDFIPTQTANVMVDFKFDAIADAQAIFGTRQASGQLSFAVLHTLANGYRFDYANWLDNSNRIADKENSHVINTYVAGIEVDGERILSVPASAKINFTAPCPMAVFGLNTAGTVGAFAKGVCRYVKAWRVMSQENTRVLDLLSGDEERRNRLLQQVRRHVLRQCRHGRVRGRERGRERDGAGPLRFGDPRRPAARRPRDRRAVARRHPVVPCPAPRRRGSMGGVNSQGKPPYRLVADDIRAKILAGEYASGKVPSERAIIRRWGVSRATATKALGILESEGLVVRRRGAGAFVNPSSHDAAQGTAFVATLIADMDVREFFSAVCGSIADRARAYNLNLIWGARREFEDLARDAPLGAYVARLKAANVRGVFFVPQDSPGDGGLRNREIAETLRRSGIAVVLIDRDIVPFPQRSDFDFVGIDNVQAGYRQAAHLLSLGCRRLVYVTHDKQVWTVDARFAGFRRALEENGLPSGGVPFRGSPADESFVRSVVRARPDGIVFVHDDMAIDFMPAWERLSRRKVRTIGLDDIKHCQSLGISSMRQPARFIGEEAARLMSLRMAHDAMPPRQILFSAELVARRSSLGGV